MIARTACLSLLLLSCASGEDRPEKWHQERVARAQAGDLQSQKQQALFLQKKGLTKEAAGWWLLAAKQGDAEAQCQTAISYRFGLGLPEDDKESVRWLLLSAKQGYPDAQLMLAMRYREGRGVLKNYSEAIDWATKAANQGHAESQFNLGDWLLNTEGLKRDKVKAYMWLNLAAVKDYQGAAGARDKLEREMTPEEIAEAQKLSREWEPKMDEKK